VLRAVGFDLDETLLVPDRDRESLLRVACERVGAPALSRAAYRRAHRAHQGEATREPVFAALLADHETDVTAAELAAAYDRAIAEAIAPVAGASDLIRNLRTRYPVGLLTDGPVAAQRGKLDRAGWTDLFDAVVVTGSLPAPKPDPRAFAALRDALGVAGPLAYVGDHPEADIEGAADAGWYAVQVLYEGGPERSAAADAVVRRERLAEALPEVLDRLDG
jgi:putative hydrolase of the HAD superfamily